MILHAAALVAFVAEQIQQAPLVVHCVQTPSSDPGWKQWAPTFVSLLSIGVGVWIALWSFVATTKRDHRRWLLDQRKAEWRELLDEFSDVYREYFPAYMSEEAAEKFIGDIEHVRRRLTSIAMPFIFIARNLSTTSIDSKIKRFVEITEEDGENIRSMMSYRHEPGTIQGPLLSAYDSILGSYNDLAKTAREVAEADIAARDSK